MSGPTSVPHRGVADLGHVVGAFEARQQRVVDALVHEEAAQRCAPLPSGAHGREGDGPQGQAEVGGGADDGGIVAAEAEDGAGEAGGQARPDMAAHRCHLVAETTGTRRSSTSASPMSWRPKSTSDSPSGASPNDAIARWTRAWGAARRVGDRRPPTRSATRDTTWGAAACAAATTTDG